MKVSTKGRYALRLMIDLAEHDHGSFIPLKEISARQGISIKYLEQIVNQLSRSGLLRSVRGAQGGYRLAKPANAYTAGEILRVTEGGLVKKMPQYALEMIPVLLCHFGMVLHRL